MNLKLGVSRVNILSVFLLVLLSWIIALVKASAISYLLESKYDVSMQDAGKVAGRLSLYGTFCTLPSVFFLGALMDVIGRKIPIVVGLMLTGASLIVMTRCHEVYPTLAILSCITSISILPTEISPFVIDYVTTESMGVATAWTSFIGLVASAFATSGVILLQSMYGIGVVFDLLGGLTIFSTLLLMCGIKELGGKKRDISSQAQF